ncbi:MAG TPA: hypothetical protein PKN50_07895 [Spirochaetota bacterium]|nr:hypothetical protein [Spirochaetota bacterium]HPV42819.1 hypothetical protein [Spirochaetota bacterium]
MRDVYVIGAHTIKFGRYLDRSIKELAADTILPCLKETGLDKKEIQALWFANSGWGYAKGQDRIRGQVALRPLGIEAIPITSVENACAGGSTAFHHAWLGVTGGLYDITMAVGAEKLHHPNKMMVFAGFLGGLDIENIRNISANISEYGMTDDEKKDDGAAGPHRVQEPLPFLPESQCPVQLQGYHGAVLADRMVTWPLTRAMCIHILEAPGR